jgi:hypothetical protein
MSYAFHEQKLEDAADRFVGLIVQLRNAAMSGRDSVEYAAKVSALASQFALASTDFCEGFSVVHCDNLDINGETPNENPDDLADWARRVSHTRSYGPFEGIRSPSRVVDLRPMLAAE